MKNVKTILALCLALILLFSLAACGEKVPEDSAAPTGSAELSNTPDESNEPEKPDEAKKVLFSCMTLTDTHWQVLDGMLQEAFEAGGYEYDSVSAEMDPVKQIEQIENANVQGYDLIVVIPVSGEALTDACQRAMDDGTMIFAFIFDTIARNSYRTTDPALISQTAVELSMEWVEKTFPDAEDGSVNCVVMGSSQDETSKTQWDAAYEAALQYPQLNVVENLGCEATVSAGQAMAENVLTTHPDIEIHLWLVCDTSMQIGVNAAIMAENSGVDYQDRVCLIATALNEEIAGIMHQSETNEGVIRVCAAAGGRLDLNVQGLFEQADKMLKGESYDPLCPVNVDRVTVENLADFGY